MLFLQGARKAIVLMSVVPGEGNDTGVCPGSVTGLFSKIL